jgi:hypothetical protein
VGVEAKNFIDYQFCVIGSQEERTLYVGAAFVRYRNYTNFLGDFDYSLQLNDTPKKLVINSFKLPQVFWKDMDLFISGKYSLMSEKAKKVISHNKQPNELIVHVLKKSEDGRKALSDYYKYPIPKGNEILSVPSTNEYWDNLIAGN